MKKIATLLLAVILLFNWFGYRILISLIERQANVQMEADLDREQYDESQLVSFKVPVTYLPYYNYSAAFVRVDGQIEIKGVQYKYVKRRIFNDSLEVLCLPNKTVMKLRNTENEFFKFANDLQPEKKAGSRNGSPKNMSLDYYTLHNSFGLVNPFTILSQQFHFEGNGLESPFLLTYEQPPDHC
jgi:hypothetical protein